VCLSLRDLAAEALEVHAVTEGFVDDALRANRDMGTVPFVNFLSHIEIRSCRKSRHPVRYRTVEAVRARAGCG
jgi:hypothetical protein